ncbi:Co2+/Mg2+ efflux protein ApaG [Pseudidiomarina taiwanensis]|uniref:Protein ApaG n=1 Tax=Pseudidiomarina taiwanensis TaxID=337250 RepID=A0A432ZE03_9GAMM|nr:Co2+/Mg2+ efflux protein ApaG [Pseudidiomarina taiwanensis]RUO75592.1 Co2+/Mg2+ efflux protein ApaG [Pseudidiomarina taiwanensis]
MHDIQIAVVTEYLEAQSVPEQNQFVFAYTITIANHSNEPVQLLRRAWEITDAEQKVTKVAGDGVVGQQPKIEPDADYSYTSGTVITTPVGTMQGHYTFVGADGEEFDVPIPSFLLALPNIVH